MTVRTGLILGCGVLAAAVVVAGVLAVAWIAHVAEDPEGLWLSRTPRRGTHSLRCWG
jgi:hypothetical protein